MPTVGQLLGQVRPNQSLNRFMWAEVVGLEDSGRTAVVQLQPGGQTRCEIPKDASPAVGDRAYVAVSDVGNVLLAAMRTPIQRGPKENL